MDAGEADRDDEEFLYDDDVQVRFQHVNVRVALWVGGVGQLGRAMGASF